MAVLWAELSEPDAADDRRISPRRRLRLTAPAAYAQRTNDVLILNLSTTGLMLETAAELRVDDLIEVELSPAGPVAARVVWRRAALCGCEFVTRPPVAAISAALLRAPRLERGLASLQPRSMRPLDGQAPLHSRPWHRRRGLVVVVVTLMLLLIAAVGLILALVILPIPAEQFERKTLKRMHGDGFLDDQDRPRFSGVGRNPAIFGDLTERAARL